MPKSCFSAGCRWQRVLAPSPPAFLWLVDITVEEHPVPVSSYQLEGLDLAEHPEMTGCHQPIEKITGEVYELEDEIAMMVRAVREGAPPAATGTDGRWSVALCLAAQESVETGQVVPLAGFTAAR